MAALRKKPAAKLAVVKDGPVQASAATRGQPCGGECADGLPRKQRLDAYFMKKPAAKPAVVEGGSVEANPPKPGAELENGPVEPSSSVPKRHRGERWGDGWREGLAPSKEEQEANAGLVSSRKGVRRKGAKANQQASTSAEAAGASEPTRPTVERQRESARPPPTPLAVANSAQASEKAAEDAVQSGEYSLESVLRALQLLEMPASRTRKNVMPHDQDYVQGMLLGLYSYGGVLGVSQKTTQHHWLTKLLIGTMRATSPDFPFTSMQLNYNYASRPHVDKNNLGTSYIVGLGDYSDGELWVHDDTGEHEFTLEGEEDVSSFYHVGRTLNGQLLQIKDTWTLFDGNCMHFTKPFEGERYSVICFTCDSYAAASAQVRRDLAGVGFDFDFEAADIAALLKDKHQRRAEIARQVAAEKAKEEQQRLLARGRCMGRVWGACWGLRCTAVCEEGSDLCGSHSQGNRWKTHGKVDEAPPEAKRDEMAYYQKRFVADGKRPPARYGTTILVPIPEWPETHHLAEAMKSYGDFRGKKARTK